MGLGGGYVGSIFEGVGETILPPAKPPHTFQIEFPLIREREGVCVCECGCVWVRERERELGRRRERERGA
jgi:hypothetical protein